MMMIMECDEGLTCDEDAKVEDHSNTGEDNQAELSPFPSPQICALPSQHHLVLMITIAMHWG